MVVARRAVQVASLGAAGGLTAFLTWPSPSKAARTSAREPMAPTHFTPATIVSTTPFAGPSKLITISLPQTTLPTGGAPGAIWSIYIKDTDLQIERPYTPLEGLSTDTGEMTFWVKRYEGGEVSRWLCSQNAGDTLEVRGPVQTWPAATMDLVGEFDEVVLISGGTGITPFYQLLHSVFDPQAASGPAPRPRLPHCTLIHSSPTTSTLPPAPMLDHLTTWARTNSRSFTLQLCVDKKDRLDSAQSVQLHEGRIGLDIVEQVLSRQRIRSPLEQEQASQSWLRPWRWKWGSDLEQSKGALKAGRVLFLVCGPDAMVHAIAGPKGRPSPGGVLGRLGFSERQVVRL